MRAQCWAASHPGSVRARNEDAYLCRPEIGLFAVADGVGGCADGGSASREVVGALQSLPPDILSTGLLPAVRLSLQGAHQRLLAAGLDGTKQSATTVAILLLDGDHLACLWAGDSRAYLVRGGRLHTLTSDHSVVGEMLRAGTLTERQAERHPRAHVITRAIGAASKDRLVDKAIGFIRPGDRVLLCTDGLSKAVPPDELAELVASPDPAAALVSAALAKRARDNVTALVVLP
jgi:serine/threonine-protein phosphatase Stp1